MNLDQLVAIDVHTHAERSCRQPHDPIQAEFDAAATVYFKTDAERPTIAETIAYYRERKIGFVMFTVDSEAGTGIRRISNEEVAEAARENSDIMMAFASIDPHKGKAGALEARRLIADYGVKGFKFHPPIQNFHPYDRMAWPIYEVIAEHRMPAIFHTGHSGMGTGMRGGGGIRLKYGQPILVDDVAVDFPDMNIILAHPSWPWTDEALSMALHKPNVFIDLSGWSPKYFPPQIIRCANHQHQIEAMFRAFGHDEMIADPRFRDHKARVENYDALKAWLASYLAGRRAEDIERALTEAGVPAAMIRDVGQISEHEHLAQRRLLHDAMLQGSGDPLKIVGPGFAAEGDDEMLVVPELGAQTGEVLAELGYDAAEIERLRETGVV